MSTAAGTPPIAGTRAAAGSSWAASTRFRTFAVVFGIAVAVIYVIADVMGLPLFTYHPGTDRIDWGWAPARRDEGPAMYWYGWIATSVLGGAVLGLIAAVLPENLTKKIPLALVWVVPIVLTPILIYSLKFFWRW